MVQCLTGASVALRQLLTVGEKEGVAVQRLQLQAWARTRQAQHQGCHICRQARVCSSKPGQEVAGCGSGGNNSRVTCWQQPGKLQRSLQPPVKGHSSAHGPGYTMTDSVARAGHRCRLASIAGRSAGGATAGGPTASSKAGVSTDVPYVLPSRSCRRGTASRQYMLSSIGQRDPATQSTHPDGPGMQRKPAGGLAPAAAGAAAQPRHGWRRGLPSRCCSEQEGASAIRCTCNTGSRAIRLEHGSPAAIRWAGSHGTARLLPPHAQPPAAPTSASPGAAGAGCPAGAPAMDISPGAGPSGASALPPLAAAQAGGGTRKQTVPEAASARPGGSGRLAAGQAEWRGSRAVGRPCASAWHA